VSGRLAAALVLAAASLLTACASGASSSVNSRPLTANTTSDGVVLEVALASTTLSAGTTGDATVTVTNSTAAARPAPQIRARILDSSGDVTWGPRGDQHDGSVGIVFDIAAGEVSTQVLSFPVPPRGDYTLEIIDAYTDLPAARLGFNSE